MSQTDHPVTVQVEAMETGMVPVVLLASFAHMYTGWPFQPPSEEPKPETTRVY
jgi:hypothetical protein